MWPHLIGLPELLLQLLKAGAVGRAAVPTNPITGFLARVRCRMVEASRYSRSSVRCTNGIGLGLAAVLDREPEVSLLHLQLGLADHVELDRLDAEGLRILAGPPRRSAGRAR